LGFYTRVKVVENPFTKDGLPKLRETKRFDYDNGNVIYTGYSGLESSI